MNAALRKPFNRLFINEHIFWSIKVLIANLPLKIFVFTLFRQNACSIEQIERFLSVAKENTSTQSDHGFDATDENCFSRTAGGKTCGLWANHSP